MTPPAPDLLPPEFELHGLRLRGYRDADVAGVVAGCADPQTQRYMPAMPHPYDDRVARDWIHTQSRADWGYTYNFAVADPDTDRLLGGAGLRVPRDGRARAEVGYWVVPEARGRGVATAAARALTEFGFAQGLGRVELLTMWGNVGSQRVALAAGFRREAELRGVLPGRDGARHDAIAWCRLAGDDGRPAPRPLPDLPGGVLTDEVVTLRPLDPGDAAVLHRLRSLPDAVATSVPPVAPPRSDSARRCERAGALWLAGTRAELLILDTASGQVAGGIGLYYREPETGQAMAGYTVFPHWRGRGYAARATALVARWAFDAGVARLAAGTAPGNAGSQRTLERVGFRREGLAVGRLPGPGGGRVDDVSWGLLPEWLAG